MKQVAHAVDEDARRLTPVQRCLQALRVTHHVSKLLRHAGKVAAHHALGVAVLAARGNLGTARRWIPDLIGPLD